MDKILKEQVLGHGLCESGQPRLAGTHGGPGDGLYKLPAKPASGVHLEPPDPASQDWDFEGRSWCWGNWHPGNSEGVLRTTAGQGCSVGDSLSLAWPVVFDLPCQATLKPAVKNKIK